MKKTQLLVTGIIATLACSMTANAQGKKDGKGRPEGRKMPAELLKKFDTDGDGTLSEEERKAMRAAMEERRAAGKKKMLEKFDTDGDGKLDEEERKAMRTALEAQRKEIHAAVLKQFDADGDGKLSEDEREGVREWVKENYPDAIHMPRGGKGGPKGGKKGGKGGPKGGKKGGKKGGPGAGNKPPVQ